MQNRSQSVLILYNRNKPIIWLSTRFSHRVHIWVEMKWGSISALSPGAYTSTLYAMVRPPPSPGWADFSIMMEFTPESGRCHSVCVLCGSESSKGGGCGLWKEGSDTVYVWQLTFAVLIWNSLGLWRGQQSFGPFVKVNCTTYTWFDTNNQLFSRYCFLFSSCTEVRAPL
jgi:hypothetical protein